MPTVELIPATSAGDLQRVENLLQFYLYDCSEWLPLAFDDSGRFHMRPKAAYWADPGTFAYFIQVDGELAGFATVDTEVEDPGTQFSVGYFFVSRRFRGTGAGAQAAAMLLRQFPGAWQIFHVSANLGAAGFWQKLVPRLATAGSARRELQIDGYDCTLYTFQVNAA